MSDPGKMLGGHLTIDREIETFDVTVNVGEVWDGNDYHNVADLYLRCEGHEVVVTLYEEDAKHVANRLLKVGKEGGSDE